jgi:predicted MPP superfamily phosphohydrolase
MMLFLISFLSIYVAIHGYVYIRLNHSFKFSRRSTVLFSGWMSFTTSAPMLVRLCEENSYDLLAKTIAWPGYTWMGFIFILTSILLLLDIIRLPAQLLPRSGPHPIHKILRPDVTAELALLLAVAISTYGFFEARNIHTISVTVATDKLPASSIGIRIVQLSDIHLGLIIREERLKEMIRAVNEAKPDILVSTGDLVDGRLSLQEGIKGYEKMTAMLASVQAPQGKFAVLGNHEFYAGIDQSIDVTHTAGFTLLRNSFIALPNGLIISGVDDPAVKQIKADLVKPSEPVLLKSLPANQFRLHLKHRPIVTTECDGMFDLQLSGHTHHGQIFPFYLLTKIRFSIPNGTTSLKSGSQVHVSNGTGTWGPPIRFLAPPEVTVIDIVPIAKDQPHSK